jgi:type III restriction enzyme
MPSLDINLLRQVSGVGASTIRNIVAAGYPSLDALTRNDNLGFTIPYEFLGVSHHYEPDFLVRYPGGKTLILEVKGWQKEEAATKHEAAKRWVSAVNTWGKMGQWAFHVNKDPQTLLGELGGLL